MECMLQTPQRTFRSASMRLILTATHLIPLFTVYLNIFPCGPGLFDERYAGTRVECGKSHTYGR